MCQRLFSLHWKVVFKKLAPDDLKKFGPGVKKKLASGDKSVRRISQEDLGNFSPSVCVCPFFLSQNEIFNEKMWMHTLELPNR